MTPEAERSLQVSTIAHGVLLEILAAKFMTDSPDVAQSADWLRRIIAARLSDAPFAHWREGASAGLVAAIEATLETLVARAQHLAATSSPD